MGLTNVTLPYIEAIANKGLSRRWRTIRHSPGVNVAAGQVTYQPVAEAVGLPYARLESVLSAA